MKLKKYIALLAAAVLSVCMLAACGPTVEHRFDDNTYSAQAEATMRSISQELGRMESLLNSHNVKLDAAFARYEDGQPGRPEGDVADTAITQDALNDWAKRPRKALCFYAESGAEIETYLAVWQGQLQTAYSALHFLTPAQRARLRRAVEALPPESAPLRSWNDAAAYIAGAGPAATPEAARAALLAYLH